VTRFESRVGEARSDGAMRRRLRIRLAGNRDRLDGPVSRRKPVGGSLNGWVKRYFAAAKYDFVEDKWHFADVEWVRDVEKCLGADGEVPFRRREVRCIEWRGAARRQRSAL